MERTQSRRSGFSIVELVLVILAIGVIGAGGWFVYQHNKPKVSNAAGNTGTTTTPTTTTTYFTISEWGIRAPYSESLKLSYIMSSDGKTATFSSDQLTALDSQCAGHGGRIIRWASTDQVSVNPTASTPTAQQFFANADQTTYSHVGNYYYTFAHAQSGCGDIDKTTVVQSQTNDAVNALAANFSAIPN